MVLHAARGAVDGNDEVSETMAMVRTGRITAVYLVPMVRSIVTTLAWKVSGVGDKLRPLGA